MSFADPGSRSVLVIDDDPSIRSMLRDVLEMEGFGVRTAEDGCAGLAQIGAQRPDCVVLDLMMPGLNGHAVLREIQRRDGQALLPVLMLTAASDDAQTWQAWAGGVDYFLPKPFDLDLLLRWVSYLCAWSPMQIGSAEG